MTDRMSADGDSHACRIAQIEVFLVQVPITRTFVFASGSAGTSGGVAEVPFVKMTGAEGIVGWSDARPTPSWNYETTGSIVSAIRDHLGPAVLGLEATDRAGLHRAMHAVIGRGPSTGMPLAKAALDQAAHDLAARSAGLSLREYLGGSRERRRLELSWTVTAHDTAAAADDAGEALDLGFRHLNFKVGVERRTDIAVCRTLRGLIPDGFLWGDANQSLSLREARTVARALEAEGCDLLEQPLRADLAFLMKDLRQATTLPLAADESTVSPADFLALVADRAVDYLVLKLTRSGGIHPSLQQLAIADAAGLAVVVSGLSDTFLTKIAAAQVAAAHGQTGPLALNGSQFLDESELFPDKPDFERGGAITLGDGPGLGCTPDEDALRTRSIAAFTIAGD